MRAGNEMAAKLMDAFDDAGLPWRSYSGRGMFGEYCVAVACRGDGSPGEGEVVLAAEQAGAAGRMRRDSLGLGVILYWPGATVLPDEGKTL